MRLGKPLPGGCIACCGDCGCCCSPAVGSSEPARLHVVAAALDVGTTRIVVPLAPCVSDTGANRCLLSIVPVTSPFADTGFALRPTCVSLALDGAATAGSLSGIGLGSC